MNVCINYYGQPRTLDHMKHTFDNYFAKTKYNLHIIYTTWDHTDISKFKEILGITLTLFYFFHMSK